MKKPAHIPVRFLGAFKAGHKARAREFIDEELSYQLLNRVLDSNYEDQEAVDALDYLTRFNNELHKAYFAKNETPLHNTPALKKDCYDKNNAKNRDISSRENKDLKRFRQDSEGKRAPATVNIDDHVHPHIDVNQMEERYLEVLVANRKIKRGEDPSK